MKRWIWLLLVWAVFSMLPNGGTELGQLRPAAVLAVREEAADILVETDTGDSGKGHTLSQAMENLRQSTPGHLFLDTVEDLIVSVQTRNLLPQLQKLLRPGVRVCTGEGIDLESAWEYLRTHIPEAVLSEITDSTALPKLTMEGEQYSLEGGGSS